MKQQASRVATNILDAIADLLDNQNSASPGVNHHSSLGASYGHVSGLYITIWPHSHGERKSSVKASTSTWDDVLEGTTNPLLCKYQ